MIENAMNNDQFAIITLTPTTLAGKPTPLDGPAAFTLADPAPAGVTLTTQSDLSTRLDVPDDFVGDVDVIASGDGKFGPDVETIQETFRFHVNHANAAALGGAVTFGDRP